jgi:hypothetical protein
LLEVSAPLDLSSCRREEREKRRERREEREEKRREEIETDRQAPKLKTQTRPDQTWT